MAWNKGHKERIRNGKDITSGIHVHGNVEGCGRRLGDSSKNGHVYCLLDVTSMVRCVILQCGALQCIAVDASMRGACRSTPINCWLPANTHSQARGRVCEELLEQRYRTGLAAWTL